MKTFTPFAFLASLVSASPIASVLESRSGNFCTFPITYKTTSQEAIRRNPELVTGSFVSAGPTGAAIAAGYSYSTSSSYFFSVTATYNINGGPAGTLGLGSISVNAGYSYTTTEGTALTSTANCPPWVTCGLTASAMMLEINGTQIMHRCGSGNRYDTRFPCPLPAPDHCPTTVFNTTLDEEGPFSIQLPITVNSSTVNGQDLAGVVYAACTVGNGTAGLEACPGVPTAGSPVQ